MTALSPDDLPSLPASTGDRLGLDRFLGKVPMVLTFTGAVSTPAAADVIRDFDDRFASFGASRVQALVIVSSDASDLDRAVSLQTNVPVLADAAGAWHQHFGVTAGSEPQAVLLLLDPDGCIVDRVTAEVGRSQSAEALAMVERWSASASLPSSTRATGSVGRAGGSDVDDGMAGLVTNVEGDAATG